MKQILEIETIEPLVIRSDTSTRNYTSLNYIPGTVIKGAFANRYIAKYGVDERFKEIFLSENIFFKNFYPISSRYKNNVVLPNPFPKTAYSCKRWPGFPLDKTKTGETHGVYDVIFIKAFSNKPILLCPKCKEPLKGMTGFYNLMENGDYASSKIDESKTLFTHTAIQYKTGTAKAGQLYNEEAVVEKQSFLGAITGNSQFISLLLNLLKENENILRLGRGRTRGYGKVKVETAIQQEDGSFKKFKERIEKFNELAKQFGGDKNKLYFTIDLVSDAIILDDYLRYKRFIDEKYISSLFNIDCRELYSASSTRDVIGWNVSWNLPKPKHSAIEKGSVFFFEAPKSQEEELLDKLFDLQSKGIGIMRDEGFGFISISDQFHIDNYFKEGKDEQNTFFEND